MFYVTAEACEEDASVTAGLQAIYGPNADIVAATLRIYADASEGSGSSAHDAFLITALPADVLPLEIPTDAECIVLVDPRRAAAYHSLILRNLSTPPSAKGRPLRILPVKDSPHVLASNALLELPSCPVCFERLDQSTIGLEPLGAEMRLPDWPNDSCPVCNYLEGKPEQRKAVCCMKCGTRKSLWLCLLCGFSGCGRYFKSHARRHYHESSHRFSLDVESSRVWDYVGDKFVHNVRTGLIADEQIHSEGKRIEQDHSELAEEQEVLNATYESKLDAIVSEYKNLLEKQLESQQMYYEEQIERRVTRLETEEGPLLKKLLEANTARREVDSANAALEKEIRSLTKTSTDCEKQLQKIESEQEWQHSLNDMMIRDQAKWKQLVSEAEAKLKAKEREKEELTEELEQLLSKIS
ncbi:hypothetical protein NDN08_006193 [Rhodosorus marinus]|uniref:UBP-type domain-containing protein n=1 Tax=Rhodosorus marinus TaxID=101924 RepID=A0AAV8UP51_9RHOD|nr:hypothetical protein NDN08_006193 [Rhodosorus marinus]